MQTEDKYGVKIPDEDLAGLRTVGDVVLASRSSRKNPEGFRRSAREVRFGEVTRPSHC